MQKDNDEKMKHLILLELKRCDPHAFPLLTYIREKRAGQQIIFRYAKVLMRHGDSSIQSILCRVEGILKSTRRPIFKQLNSYQDQ